MIQEENVSNKIVTCPSCNQKILEKDAIYCSNCGYDLNENMENITKYEIIFNYLVNIPLTLILAYLVIIFLGFIPNFHVAINIFAMLIFLLIVCYIVATGFIWVARIKHPNNSRIIKRFRTNEVVWAFVLPIIYIIIEIYIDFIK